MAARLPVVLGLRALPEHADPQIAGVHLPIARPDPNKRGESEKGNESLSKRQTFFFKNAFVKQTTIQITDVKSKEIT